MADTDTNEYAFPVEIFDLIIKELTAGARSDYLPSLKACSLVSKSFFQLCRPIIFRSITYGPFGNAGSARTQFAHLFTDDPLLGTYVKSVTYLIRPDGEPAIDEESVHAEARKRYKLGSTFGEEGSLAGRGLPMEAILSAVGYRHYIAMGGRVDDFQFALSKHVPNVESLSIVHQSCHETPTDASYPCDNRYCHEFCLVVLDEFGESAPKTLTSLSINGIDYIPAWRTLKFPNLQSLELVRCGLTEWNRSEDMDDDDEEDEDTSDEEDEDTPPWGLAESEGPEVLDEVVGMDSDSDWETVHSDEGVFTTLPKLRHLKVDNITSFSFNIIQHLPLLETISMKNVEHYTSELRLDESNTLTSLPNLHTLITNQLYPWNQICEDSTTAFPSLRVLDAVVVNSDDLDVMNAIFDHVEVLETLTLSSEYGESEQYIHLRMNGLDLWSCFILCKATLKNITIRWHHQGYDPDDTVIAALCDALDNVEGDNVIESITVVLDLESVHVAASNPRPKFEEWRRLDVIPYFANIWGLASFVGPDAISASASEKTTSL